MPKAFSNKPFTLLSGVVPGKYDRPTGCLLNPRCPYATEHCYTQEPALVSYGETRKVKCHYPLSSEGIPQYEQ